MRELAALFLELNSIALGGPTAQIAMMEDEVVTKWKWITPLHFLTEMIVVINWELNLSWIVAGDAALGSFSP